MNTSSYPARFFVALTLLSTTAAGALPTAQTPQFRSTVELVQLQVSLVGRDGRFVSGLGPDDFVLRIDGEERPVQVVYEVDLRTPSGEPGSATVTLPRGEAGPRPVAARRHFLIFFDFSFTDRRGVIEARRAALEFVDEQVHPDDLIAVATYNRFGFRLLAPFTADHDQALAAVNSLGLVDSGDIVTAGFLADESIEQALTELAQSRAGDDGGTGDALRGAEFAEYVGQVANYTGQMERLGELLQAIEGRKHVVMFSRGFADRALTGQSLNEQSAAAEARAQSPLAFADANPEEAFGSSEVRRGLQDMIEAFRGADAVVHAIDPSGLRNAGFDPTRQVSALAASGGSLADASGRQALVAMAEGTGGTVSWNMNDLSQALEAIEESTSTFYMIGYRREADDPATVDVEVRVRSGEVQVTSAPSRLTPPPSYGEMDEAQRQLQLAEFLADDVDRRDLSFEAQLVPFPETDEHGKLAVILEIPGPEIERLAAERGDDRVQLELAALARGAEQSDAGGVVRRGITVDVARMRDNGPMFEQTVRLADYLQLPPGEYRVRVLVREKEIGRLSSRTIAAWLPGAPDGRLSIARPLILSAGSAPTPPEGAIPFDPLAVGERRVVPEAAPVVSPGGIFRALVVVYHLPRHPVSGEIQAGLVLEIEGSDGEYRRVREFEIIGSRHDGGHDVTQLVIEGTLPAETPTGSGRLWASMIDGITGKRVEEQTSIFVVEGSR